VPYDASGGKFINQNGKIADGLYCAGWARRGPTGTIGTNKPDGAEVATLIIGAHSATPAHSKTGRAALQALLESRNTEIINFAAWQKIDAAEMAAAKDGAPRQKFARVADMLAVAQKKSVY
jgi:NADPH-dependent glutamate synthase beta subunit-like oxidoreductase